MSSIVLARSVNSAQQQLTEHAAVSGCSMRALLCELLTAFGSLGGSYSAALLHLVPCRHCLLCGCDIGMLLFCCDLD
jgi:hypothetical protein